MYGPPPPAHNREALSVYGGPSAFPPLSGVLKIHISAYSSGSLVTSRLYRPISASLISFIFFLIILVEVKVCSDVQYRTNLVAAHELFILYPVSFF